MAMTANEKKLRQLVVDTAEAWVGTKQGDANHKKIVAGYNSISPLPSRYTLKLSDAWCAGFASMVGNSLGLTDYILPECSCNRMIALYKAKNQWVEDDAYVPDAGDVLFYAWNDSGTGDCQLEANHVGIVKEVKDNIIYVIEGNYSKQVKIRQIKVNGRYIRGFAAPDYKTASKSYNFSKKVAVKPTTTTTTTKATTATTAIKTVTSTVPYLKNGDENDAVKVMQTVLIYLGFSCGSTGADGSFGTNTVKAAKAYQKALGLTQDGICGKDTWKNLLLGKKTK